MTVAEHGVVDIDLDHPTAPVPGISSGGTGQTTRPLRDASDLPPARRRVGGVTSTAVFNAVGALAVSICVTTLLFGRLAPFSGLIGFVVVAYLVFLAAYAALTSLTEDGPAVRDVLMTVLLYSAAMLALGALGGVVSYTLWSGRKALFHGNFFTQDLSSAGPTAAFTIGGIQHALVGSLEMIAIALIITVPLGMTCAVYLNVTKGRFSRFVRTVVEAMTALPSILAGLFVFATWILLFHFEKSGLAAALALSVEMLPIMIRASDVVLRLVPGNLREASSALGSPTWRTTWHVVLPTARSGLVTAVILSTARGVGETAPVLLTAGYTTYLNTNPIHGPMVSLPLVAFQLVRSGEPGYVARGFGAAAFLLLIVLTLFVIARAVGGRGPGNLTSRQLSRAMRASAADRDRFIKMATQGGNNQSHDLEPEPG